MWDVWFYRINYIVCHFWMCSRVCLYHSFHICYLWLLKYFPDLFQFDPNLLPCISLLFLVFLWLFLTIWLDGTVECIFRKNSLRTLFSKCLKQTIWEMSHINGDQFFFLNSWFRVTRHNHRHLFLSTWNYLFTKEDWHIISLEFW